MMRKIDIGDWGEKMASDYLKSKGYKIEYRNYHCRYGELDIIAIDKKTLVIVEVKTRTSDVYGTPAEAITSYKKRNIINCTNAYMLDKKYNDDVRIDVIEVYCKVVDSQFHFEKINHIINAF